MLLALFGFVFACQMMEVPCLQWVMSFETCTVLYRSRQFCFFLSFLSILEALFGAFDRVLSVFVGASSFHVSWSLDEILFAALGLDSVAAADFHKWARQFSLDLGRQAPTAAVKCRALWRGDGFIYRTHGPHDG